MLKLLFALSLLFLMAQAAGLAIELTLLEWEVDLAAMRQEHPKVTWLKRYHGVQEFTFRDDLQEYGFWRDGKWCPAR